MAINFSKVRWKNFLSTGNQFTEVKLNTHATTLIVGENGAGKSTILDVLCFNLFNKPFRNITKPQLINSINQKNMVTELHFSIGKNEYVVVRGSKPSIFEIYINGEMVNQDSNSKDYQYFLENSILKLNYKSFTQIVILGSASFTPFMQLTLPQRREVIEDILDIKIFTAMNDCLKEKIAEVKAEILTLDTTIEIGKTKVKLQQQYIESIDSDKEKKRKETEDAIAATQKKVSGYVKNLEDLNKKVEALKESILDKSEVEQKEKNITILLDRFNDKTSLLREEISFYETNDSCPTCKQSIEDSFKNTAMTDIGKKLDEILAGEKELTMKLSENTNRYRQIETTIQEISELHEKIIENQKDQMVCQNWIEKLQKTLIVKKDVNLAENKKKLKELAKEVVTASEERTLKTQEKYYLDVAGLLLKDNGIKTKVIKQYLPTINNLINKFLADMDFFCHIELDETFNESIKSRHRDEFGYSSFSEGEKAKIDLAILLCWRAIARMKNSVNTNLLLLDEIFDGSLDINGTDFVMNILKTMGEDNVFIISHKEALFDKFDSVIKFKKINEFSQST
jgi:DNA repair exonuclease SbcCD ATPase subunit